MTSTANAFDTATGSPFGVKIDNSVSGLSQASPAGMKNSGLSPVSVKPGRPATSNEMTPATNAT